MTRTTALALLAGLVGGAAGAYGYERCRSWRRHRRLLKRFWRSWDEHLGPQPWVLP